MAKYEVIVTEKRSYYIEADSSQEAEKKVIKMATRCRLTSPARCHFYDFLLSFLARARFYVIRPFLSYYYFVFSHAALLLKLQVTNELGEIITTLRFLSLQDIYSAELLLRFFSSYFRQFYIRVKLL